MDFRQAIDPHFLSSLMDGSHFATAEDMEPQFDEMPTDPLSVDAPAPVESEGDLVSPPASAGVPEPAVEAPVVTPEPTAAPAAPAPAPTGADALFNNNSTSDDRADTIFGA